MQYPAEIKNPENGAIIDQTGQYRYLLWRTWDAQKPRVAFIMLNPSTADGTEDDPTIRRCIGFAKDWNYGGIEVVNLFAYRATDPKALWDAVDPVGIENEEYLFVTARRAPLIIAAWGALGWYKGRDRQVMKLLGKYDLHCLEVTRDGHPKHPLFVRKDIAIQKYTARK